MKTLRAIGRGLGRALHVVLATVLRVGNAPSGNLQGDPGVPPSKPGEYRP